MEDKTVSDVVFFSGGMSSYFLAKRVAEKYGTDNLILFFTDTLIEDEDLYRFLDEAAEDVGGEFVKIADGRTPWEVFKDSRMLGNSRIDPCSRVLKRELAKKWIHTNFPDPETVRLWIGMNWDEGHRLKKSKGFWAPYKVDSLLFEQPILTRRGMMKGLEKVGIEPPRLYKLNFSHNNCFSPQERFITKEGLKSFKEACGQQVEVLGVGGHWKQASIESFGEQRIVELVVSRHRKEKVIYTTADHRWFVCKGSQKEETLTNELCPGDVLYSMYASSQDREEDWKVLEVRETEHTEEVMCAVVPDGHAFTLEDNIFTGNCGGGCVKAGQAHFRHLLKTLPDVYAEWEQKEEEMRQFLDRDVSILQETRDGKKRRLTLKELRERKESDCDMEDWGGCGCFAVDSEDEPTPDVFDLLTKNYIEV